MFEFMLSLIVCLFLGVIVVRFSRFERTWIEAIRICTSFLKKAVMAVYDELKKPKPIPVVNYPVWIGIEEGTLKHAIVESYFSDLKRFYQIISFEKANFLNEKRNVIFYCFSCIKEKEHIEGKELIDLMCQVSEVALRKYLRDYGFSLPVPPSQVIATRLVHGKLAVYIACTNYGLEEINQIKNHVRNSHSGNPPKSAPLETDWEEEEKF